MTVQLDWPPDVVGRLTEEARQKGLSLDEYVLQTVLQQKGSDAAPTDDAEKRRTRAEAGARILEIQKRVRPDPEGWTSRDYIKPRTPLMAAVVIDASIASAWCFPDEQTDYTKAVFQAVSSSAVETVAPRLWAYEIRNKCSHGDSPRPDQQTGQRTVPDFAE